MEIAINAHKKVVEIEKEFNKAFPSLRLEFYSKASKKGGAPSKKLMHDTSKTISSCLQLMHLLN